MKCGCNLDAVIREVKKDGPNQGKKFYTCSQKQGSQCEFFEWIDKPAPKTSSGVQSQALTNISVKLDRLDDRMDKMAELLKEILSQMPQN